MLPAIEHDYIGAVGGRHQAVVDEYGSVRPDRYGWWLDWWIGADDRWHVPASEVAVRRTLRDGLPVVETAMRVPGGDAVHRAYGVGGPGDLAVVEIENASPAPFVGAFVVRGARDFTWREGSLLVDRLPVLTPARSPSRWAATRDGRIQMVVTGGGASPDVPGPLHDRGARLDVALLYPVPHRTRIRLALTLGRSLEIAAPDELPGADDVVRGWERQLERACRVEVPDEQLTRQIRGARAALLLAASRTHVDGETVAALEAWGFDEEAADAWPRLGRREQKRAAQRGQEAAGGAPATASGWPEVRTLAATGDPSFLLSVRALLVRDRGGGHLEVVPEWPSEWRGLGLEVHDAPTRAGLVSFAVRWHGERPALLWSVPAGAHLRAPGLDASWETDDENGEALLGAS